MNTNIISATVAACIASLAMGAGAAHAEIPDEDVVGGIFDITGQLAGRGRG